MIEQQIISVCFPGSFYAASEEESTVLALGSDSSNETLVTGDSQGWISLWDISSYCITRTDSTQAQVFVPCICNSIKYPPTTKL